MFNKMLIIEGVSKIKNNCFSEKSEKMKIIIF